LRSTLVDGGSRNFRERVTGIEPASSAWKAEVLPLNYTRRNPVRLSAWCGSGRCVTAVR
jgi:hypothetical protein